MIDGILPPRRAKKTRPDVDKYLYPTATNTERQTDAEPSFIPPELVAEQAVSSTATDSSLEQLLNSVSPVEQQANGKKKRRFTLKLTKKTAIIGAAVMVLLLGGGGAAAYKLTHNKKSAAVAQTPPAPAKPVEPPKPTTLASPLTGLQVSPELAQLPVTGVMIENSPDARPQSGLRDAGIVFEAIAEGGITRFLALFQESQPGYVGPVRSVRPYYLEWLQGYDAAIAHVGGSPEALSQIQSESIKDLDQFYNSGAYRRITSRYAPHNVYTSLADLLSLEKQKGYTKSTFTAFARKADTRPATPTVSAIDFTLSGYLYNPHFDYDASANAYNRSQAGAPHLDDKTGAQIQSKVVIAIVVPFGIKVDGLHSDYSTTGTGKAFIFQDGAVTVGTWSKASSKGSLAINDANGAPLPLNSGQTWITAVGTEGSVAYH